MKKILLISIPLFIFISIIIGVAVNQNPQKKTAAHSYTNATSSRTETSVEQEKYVSGYATSTNWTSSYLNLRYDVPAGWRMSDPLLLERANNLYEEEGRGQIEEMIAQRLNNNGAMEKQVYVVAFDLSINYPNMTVDEIIQKEIESTEQQIQQLSTNGVEMKCNIDSPRRYSLCGTDFTMVHLETDKYFNGAYTGTTYGWALYKIVGDSVLMISCTTPSSSDTLEYMLAGFSKY